MSCNNTVARDFMKNFKAEDRKKDCQASSSSESDAYPDHKTSWPKKNTVRSFDLFQKHHLSRMKHHIQKSAEGDTRKARNSFSGRCLVPLDGRVRPPSFLERQLLPSINDAIPVSASEKSKAAQLTIFYKGAINVYDNVSVDKARAIMLVAGENSQPVPAAVKNVDASKTIEEFSAPPVCKLQPNLPVARRHSLRLFFDKRRDRIKNKFLYATSMHEQEQDH
ncbi:hypothetical protein ACJIZ3_001075 [Penstemon smallii]|uniref:Protein TIFY n=1 Tax=Penstemon smallii TaxID=265156 RepID=A0ABD3U3M7_9LAMI